MAGVHRSIHARASLPAPIVPASPLRRPNLDGDVLSDSDAARLAGRGPEVEVSEYLLVALVVRACAVGGYASAGVLRCLPPGGEGRVLKIMLGVLALEAIHSVSGLAKLVDATVVLVVPAAALAGSTAETAV